MAYQNITQYTSPNTWGHRPSAPTSITIHWWGDPNSHPTFESTISWLCQSRAQVSANYVAEAGRVACIVDPDNTSWHAGNTAANKLSISIECNPRCSDADYETVGELVANLRKTYGNLPLYPHKHWSNTACPGNYDLNRINSIANSKGGAGVAHGSSSTVSTAAPADSTSGDIRAIQSAVHVTADNIWGRNTDKGTYAVRMASNMHGNKMPYGVAFLQKTVGTVADGILGRKTWAAHTNTVKKIQQTLNVTTDGIWGTNTQNAIDALYQRSNHIV